MTNMTQRVGERFEGVGEKPRGALFEKRNGGLLFTRSLFDLRELIGRERERERERRLARGGGGRLIFNVAFVRETRPLLGLVLFHFQP